MYLITRISVCYARLILYATERAIWFSRLYLRSINTHSYLLSPEGAFLYFTWFVFFTVRGTDTAYKSGTLHLKLGHGVTIARGDRYCLEKCDFAPEIGTWSYYSQGGQILPIKVIKSILTHTEAAILTGETTLTTIPATHPPHILIP